jgi:ureidoacrylate peracid hydrolase
MGASLSSQTSGRVVTIEAQPEPIAIDTAKTAVIVVDMQNDFGATGGMLDRAGIDLSPIHRAIAPTAQVLSAARKASISIVYLKMGFRADLSDAGPPDSPNRIKHLPLAVGESIRTPSGAESRILIRDTWNTDILEELTPQPGDIVLYKTRFSGFYKTDLDSVLQKLGVKYLIIMGCTTSVCVESTIRDAMFRDYCCVLLADCTGEPVGHQLARSNHEASLLVIERLFGWVSRSENLLRVLEDHK